MRFNPHARNCLLGIITLGLSLPSARALIGDAMMVAAAMLWGATTVLVKASKLTRIEPAKTLAYQLAVSAVTEENS